MCNYNYIEVKMKEVFTFFRHIALNWVIVGLVSISNVIEHNLLLEACLNIQHFIRRFMFI